MFPISRDPPEGGTTRKWTRLTKRCPYCFQFLGIPPKGERDALKLSLKLGGFSFQFLGIPPKGERA